MNAWKVILDRASQRTFRRLPRDLQRRLGQAIQSLAINPRPPGCRKLVGYDDLWRIRVGSWRIIYHLDENQSIVTVIRIAPRSSAYRNPN